jgi:ornithine--oxo-acid transaminase
VRQGYAVYVVDQVGRGRSPLIEKAYGPSKIGDVRGAGQLTAMEIVPNAAAGLDAWQFCLRLAENGMITKPTRDTIVRLAPPLTLTEAQCLEMVDIIGRTLRSFD